MMNPAVLGDVVIGPHSGLTRWVFDLVSRLVQHAPDRTTKQIDRTDVVDFYAEPRAVFLTNYPSRQIVDAVESNDVRVLFVGEDPLDAIHYLKSALGLPQMEALRAVTATSVAHLAIGQSKYVKPIMRTTERTIGQISADVAQHLRLRLQPEVVSSVASDVSGGLGPDAPVEDALRARGDAYAPPIRASGRAPADPFLGTASEILDPLMAMALGDRVRPVVWPTEVFKFADRPDEPAPRTADVAGPVRNLYYGPYLYLPPAHYRVEAVLSFSDDIKDVPFVLEMHSSTWLARARIEKRKGNDYRGYFALEHFDPTATVEIRLRNERGVDHGRLSLIELLFFVRGAH